MEIVNLEKYINPTKVKIFNENEIQKYIHDFFLDTMDINGTYCYEYINPKLLKFVLENKKRVEKILKYENEELNYMFNIMAIIDKININGFYQTSYYQSPCGRQFIINDISFQKFKREIKGLFSYGLYYDIDIVNAHPTLLCKLCEFNDYENYDSIIEYRDNRKECINELLQLNPNLTKDDVKMYIIAIMNGGYSFIHKFKVKTDFLKGFRKDVEYICNKLKETYKKDYDIFLLELIEKNKRKKNEHQLPLRKLKRKAKKRVVSFLMMDMENSILKRMIAYFKDRKFIKNDLVIKIFDGFQISNDVKKEVIEEHFIKIQDTFKSEWDFKIKFLIKDFDNCKELLKIVPKNLLIDKIPENELKELIEKNQFNLKKMEFINNKKTNEMPYNISTSQKYLDPYYEHLENNDTLFIKSPMGSGKTFNLYKCIKKLLNPKKNKIQTRLDGTHIIQNLTKSFKNVFAPSILFISFRKTLEKKYTKDLPDFKYYEDIKTHFIDADIHKKLVIQINSIHRIIGKYDIIILDEVSYIFDTLISFCKNKRKIYDSLSQMLKNCDKCICMDAYMGKNEIDYIKYLRPNKKNFTIINTINGYRGNVRFYHKDTFIGHLMKDLKNKENVIFASNSKTYIEKQIIPELKRLDIKYLFLNNESDVIDPDTWVNYQIVLYTPTIVAGISFEKEHFDKRYSYFSNISSSANMCAQQIFRVRETTDPNLHILLNQVGGSYNPTTKKDIDKYLENYINLETSLLSQNEKYCINNGFITIDIINKQFKKDEYYDLLVNYISKINKSKNNLKKELLDYLAVQGYCKKQIPKINDITDEVEKFKKKHKETVRDYCDDKEIEEIDLYRTMDVPDLTEYEHLTNKDRKKKIDKIKINLFTMNEQKIDIKELEDDTLHRLIKNPKSTRFDNLLKNSLDENPEEFTLKKLMYHSKKHGRNTNLRDYIGSNEIDEDEFKYVLHKQPIRDYWLRCHHALKIIKLLGFIDFNDFDTHLPKFEEPEFKNVHNYILKNWNDFNILFGISEKMKDFNLFIGNNFASLINSKIKIINRKIKRKTIGGKKNRIILYNLVKYIEI